ncbi:MAG TPA: choice-of-anchor D domain-containing protein, partial [Terriglobia bacterium]|nr:choice-of-anchor D domain-containing protein [Terriglobia bacterium]
MKSCNPLKLKLLVLLLTAWTWIAAPVHGQNSPVPQIDLPLVPASAEPGGPAFTLTVNGAGFVSGSAVYWNGNSRTTTFVSSMQLTALINAADIATAGTASVTVMNPAPGGGYSDVAFFEVTNPASTVSLTGVTSSTGNSPTSVVVAQFNGDGFQDLAVTNEADNTVSILLGNGNGTFQPHVDYATGYGPEDVSVGDFNHDGVLDLAVVNGGENLSGQPANSVSILLGNGDGTFQAHVDYPTGQFPFRVAVGDFNGDGNLDLAIVAEYDNAVSILLGNGDGTFQPEIEYGVSAQPTSIVVSDFNGDGILDLAVANFVAHSVSILLGNGDGTFQPASDYNATENPASLAAADFNGDGIPDLAVADFGSAAVSILIGNGDGTFQNQVRYATGTYPEGVAVGDFNGDGILDLALPNDNDLGSISVLLGTTNETFQSALSFPGGLLPVSVAAADFNDDGMLDAVTTDVNNNAVSVMLSTTLAFTPTSINFGSVNIGVTSSPQTVTLTNIGTSALSLSSIATAAPYNQTNNTCSGSLGAGATCRVSVTFTPTGAGTAPGALTITDGAIGSPQIVMLSGSGSGPVASFSPSSFNFGNQIVGTTSTAQIVTLTNTGNATLNISSLTAAGAYAIASTNCGSALAASANCTITVTFTPTQTGTLNGGISLADNAYQSPQTVPLTGVGTQGTAILNPTSLTFNVQLLNTTSAAQTVTLTNEGTAVLTINSVSNPNSFLQTNNCGTTVAVGGSCTFTVTFHPAMIGNLGASFVISDNGANSPQSISLSGTATEVSLNPTSLNFGSVNLGTSSSAMTVTLTNVGSSSMSISPITFGGADPADFAQTNTCGSSVGAGASCTFSVTFTPGGVGTRTATLSITDTGGASPQTVTLSGTGNPTSSGPAAQFAPSSVNFGNQNYNTKSLAQIVTVTDTGAANLSIASAGTTISDYAVTNNCPSTITPGANCTFSITFTPAAVGTRNGALTVSDNAPGSPQSVPLTGIGVGAVAGLSPASLTYGLQLVGTNSASQALTLSNTGNATLTVSKLTISTNFTETDNC